jgi:hypothetical protein
VNKRKGRRKENGRRERYRSTSVVKLLSRLCLDWPGPGPSPSSPPCARLAMLMCSADLRKTGQTDSRWGAEAQNQRGMGPVAAVEAR